VFLVAMLLLNGARMWVITLGAADPFGARGWLVAGSRVMYLPSVFGRGEMMVGLGLVLAAYAMRVAGAWLTTARPPARAVAAAGPLVDRPALRWAARVAMTLPVVVLIGLVAWSAWDDRTSLRGRAGRDTVLLILLAVEAPGPVLAWLYFAVVARRLERRRTAIACVVAAWPGLVGSVLLMLAFANNSAGFGYTGVFLNLATAIYAVVLLTVWAGGVRAAARERAAPPLTWARP
ncbi:MAG TPA: hypothetical protein VEA69_19025, partial [Tepidisphaeraceae bacterium]|nr:hypothetical protein [Tepidisphaeraceae bacterium]